MQILWAKILAGEFKQPGSYSRHAMSILRSMDEDDATFFNTLGRYVWIIGGEPVPLIYDFDSPIYEAIDLPSLTNLSALGLVTINGGASVRFKGRRIISYQGVEYGLLGGNERMSIGCVMLTKAGDQLFKICHPIAVPYFVEYVSDQLRHDHFYMKPVSEMTPEELGDEA